MDANTEKIRIFVAFGDISGFTAFCDSVTNDEIEYDPFMEKFDELVEEIERETGYPFDDTGDGFMCTVDLPQGDVSQKVCRILIALWKLLKKLILLIEEKDAPRPDGFRIVGASGYVKRKLKKKGPVLRGKHINKAHNLLDKARGYGLVLDESAKQLVSGRDTKKYGISFIKLDNHLWMVKVKR